jgi:hypothetical protein
MEIKRSLSEYEIENILDFIKPQNGIPVETSLSIINNNKSRLKSQLISIKIYPSKIHCLKKIIEQQYITSIIQSGECVGVIGAQSIGEKQTQSTLNTFHKAGSGATNGVSRVDELLNATKSPKSVNFTVYTKEKQSSIKNLRSTIGHNIVEITFAKIIKKCDVVCNKKPEAWYKSFTLCHNNLYEQYNDCLCLTLNMDILYEYKLKMETISEIISEEYSDMVCVFSPDSIGRLDIFVDVSNIQLPENRISFVNTSNAVEIYLEEVVQPILNKICICGIAGLKEIYFCDDPNKFGTDGGDYKKILGLPFIDATKTVSNNVWNIYHTLGIEAASEMLINEFMQICEGINDCHIQLLIGKMTFNGTISSISRYTMRNDECGPMGKASFEETMDNFLNAGAYGQKEQTKGVSASIICGKRANIGTGVCSLMIDLKKLPINKNVILKEKIEEKFNVLTLALPKSIKDQKVDIERLGIKLDIKNSDTNKDKRLTKKDFLNKTVTAEVYKGTVNFDSDGKINLNFDFKKPLKVSLTWEKGLLADNELYMGFDKVHGIYLNLNEHLKDLNRFMKILEIKKLEKESDNDIIEEMGYLDF